MAFIGMMAVIVVILLNPRIQMAKGRDARRKTDLQKLKNSMEDYFNDNQCYPARLSFLVSYYLREIPKDPETNQEYVLETDGCDKYWVYANLEITSDPAIAAGGCSDGCGPENRYNFGVASGNTRLVDGSTEIPPAPPGGDQFWGCRSGSCIDLTGEDCLPKYAIEGCWSQCRDMSGNPIHECQ